MTATSGDDRTPLYIFTVNVAGYGDSIEFGMTKNIRVNISRLDLLRVSLLLVVRSPWSWLYFGALLIGTFSYMFFSLAKEFPVRDFLLLIIQQSLFISVVLYVAGLLPCLALNIAFASPRTGLGQHSFDILEEGLKEQTDLNQEISYWPAFKDIWNFGSHIVLRKNWAAIHILPRRDFESVDDYNQLFEMLCSKIKNSQ